MTTDVPSRFEDRLLASILADFDELRGSAPVAPAPAPCGRRRRRPRRPRTRRRTLRLALPTAAIAATAAVLVIILAGHGVAVGPAPGRQVLYRLAADAARAPALDRRYAIQTESGSGTGLPGTQRSTIVVDARTGSTVTYQSGFAAGTPRVLRSGPAPARDASADLHPASWYSALPTASGPLRARLLELARGGTRVDARINARAARAQGSSVPARPGRPPSDADQIYSEASDLLWNPLVAPDLRAALYRVLARQPGVRVDTRATDPAGRPAIRISRSWSAYFEPQTDTTYEDPRTGATLAQTSRVLRDRSTTVYGPVRGADAIPRDPYRS